MDPVLLPTPAVDVIVAADNTVQLPKAKRRCYLPMRFVLAALCFLGNINYYGMRVNLNVALVAMVNQSDSSQHQHYSYCEGLQNDSHRTDTAGEFEWSSVEQSAILTSFFYGYLVTQLPGSCISMYFSAKWTVGLSVLLSAILNLLTPLAAYQGGYLAVIASRVLLGLAQGVYFPALDRLVGLWMPPAERSTIFSFVCVGLDIGSLLFLYLSGVLASSNIFQGWPSVFYMSGFLGLCWCLLWFPLAYDSPAVHPWISRYERDYLMTSLKLDSQAHRVSSIPWGLLLLSVPVWSFIVCQLCVEFGFYIFLTESPEYFSSIQGFDLSQSGLLSGLPFILELSASLASSLMADFLNNHNLLRVVTIRKASTFIGGIAQCSLLIATAYSGCDTALAVVCFVTAIAFSGFHTPGYSVNRFDITPNSAAVVTGISNIFSTLGGILGPYLVAFLTGMKPTVKEWQYIFWMISGVVIFGVLSFVIFGSGEHQAWDKAMGSREDQSTPGNRSDEALLPEASEESDTDG